MTMIVVVKHKPNAYIIASDSLYTLDETVFHAGKKWREYGEDIVCMSGSTPYPDDFEVEDLFNYCKEHECDILRVGPTGMFRFSPQEVYKLTDNIAGLGSGMALGMATCSMSFDKIIKATPAEALNIVDKCLRHACKYASGCGKPIHTEYFEV